MASLTFEGETHGEIVQKVKRWLQSVERGEEVTKLTPAEAVERGAELYKDALQVIAAAAPERVASSEVVKALTGMGYKATEQTKEAVITGLERTGGVITSAGIILAGTFCALMALPLETLFQLGFTVAFGLLVDTFIVRTILVPAIAFELGEKNWWPSKISHDQAAPDS